MNPVPPGGIVPAPGPAPLAPGQAPGGAQLAPAGGAQLANEEQVLFAGAPALIPSLGALLLVIFTLGLAAIYLYLKRGGTTYRVTTQRIVIDSGIFSRKMEQLDLYRVNDFTIERPFGQRIMGTGNLRLTTFDKTSPILELDDLKTDVMALYEVLRHAVEAARATRGVRLVDYE